MKNKLLLLRHGKSDWSTDAEDFDRPIKDRGKRAAQRIGVWLAQQDLVPDKVISSPAERAKVTAQKTLKAMGRTDHEIIYDSRIYEASVNELLAIIAKTSKKTNTLMIVGHNPGMESLLCYLADEKIVMPADGKLFPTATLAILELDISWRKIAKRSAKLKKLIKPRSLPKGFPYPLPFGKEQRIRPAYYYTQSSVIPYRYNKDKLEILVVSSSKRKHFVVPKGIKEPGLSPQHSAAKEAQEEAGVKGIVAEQPIGSYVYEKWEAPCTVEVYPMQVTKVINANKWEEKHRGRYWMSVTDAHNALYQEALKPMILKLESFILKKRKINTREA